MIRPTTYTIFLSRPSDVESDIDVVKEAVADANVLAAPLGVHFGLFDWRENATPGLAAEPQARINDQADGYDVLLALVGATLGTPTLNHDSGTVEEIESAIRNAESSRFGNDSVLIFFKDVSLSMSSDLEEAKRVQILKQSLGPRGILYKQYNDDESLRQGVLRCIGVLIASHFAGKKETASAQSDPVILETEPDFDEDIDDLGLIDYGQIAEEEMKAATLSAGAVGTAMRFLGEFVDSKAPMLTAAQTADDKREVKSTLSDVANAMETCAETIVDQGDEMTLRLKRALSATRSIIDIQGSDLSPTAAQGELELAVTMTDDLAETLQTVIGQLSGFRSSISTLPRLTRELNTGKRKLLQAVERLISCLEEMSEEILAINSFARSHIE